MCVRFRERKHGLMWRPARSASAMDVALQPARQEYFRHVYEDIPFDRGVLLSKVLSWFLDIRNC